MKRVTGTISHQREDESLEAKARWFGEKTAEERLQSAFEDMAFVNAIQQCEHADDRSTFATVRELKLPQG